MYRYYCNYNNIVLIKVFILSPKSYMQLLENDNSKHILLKILDVVVANFIFITCKFYIVGIQRVYTKMQLPLLKQNGMVLKLELNIFKICHPYKRVNYFKIKMYRKF